MPELTRPPQEVKFKNVFARVLAAARSHHTLTKVLVDGAMARHIARGGKYEEFGDLGSEEIELAQQLGMNLHIKLRAALCADAKNIPPKTPQEAAAALTREMDHFQRVALQARQALERVGKHVISETGKNDKQITVGAGALLQALGNDAATNPNVRIAFGETWRNPRYWGFTPADVELVSDAAAGIIASHLIPARTDHHRSDIGDR